MAQGRVESSGGSTPDAGELGKPSWLAASARAADRALETADRGVRWALAPRRVWLTLAAILTVQGGAFGFYATHRPVIPGDETFTLRAVAELHRSGDLLYVLRAKRHHPLPYVVMAAFVDGDAPTSPAPLDEGVLSPRPPSSELIRLRCVSGAAWCLAGMVLFLLAGHFVARPEVALVVFASLPMLPAFQARPYTMYLLVGLIVLYALAALLTGPRRWVAPATAIAMVSACAFPWTMVFAYLYFPGIVLVAARSMRRAPLRAVLALGVVAAAMATSFRGLTLWLSTGVPASLEPHPLLERTNLAALAGSSSIAALVVAASTRRGRARRIVGRVAFVLAALPVVVKPLVFWGLPLGAVAVAWYLGATGAAWALLHGAVVVPYLLVPEPCFDHLVLPSAALVALYLAYLLEAARGRRIGRLASAAVASLALMALTQWWSSGW